MKKIWLSYSIDNNTPIYGGRNENLNIYKTSSIKEGKIANDTKIESTLHVGTHIDMPCHFYEDGQSIEDFDIDYWFFSKPLFIEVEPKNFVIKDELVGILDKIKNDNYDILIIKTGICAFREEEKYWRENYGFAPEIYEYLIEKFPSIRIMGFDSISISSWKDRSLGKVAHKAFLNPKKPILLLEDMDLNNISIEVDLEHVIVSPLRIIESDGLPCSVFANVFSQCDKK